MIIPSRNLLAEQQITPVTYLTNAEVAGTSVLRWANASGFSASWALQIGKTGEEQTEVVLLGASTPAGTAGTLTANTLYEHPANTPLYGIKFDQVVFERSTAGTAGTASPMTNGTITYQADKDVTIFDDTSGTSTYAYKTYFRSSVLAVNSIESDWITSGGFSFYSLAKLRERERRRLWNADYLTDDVLDDWNNEWKDEMTNAVIAVNEDYALGTVDVSFGTAGLGTVTTADFSQPRRVDIVTSSGTYQSTKQNVNDYLPGQIFQSTNPYHNWVGDSVIEVHPADSGGTARITFYRFGTTMVNDTDELPMPMRSYTKSFIDYCEAQALAKDGKTEQYRDKMGAAMSARNDFVNKITPRDKSGPTKIHIVESTSPDDINYF